MAHHGGNHLATMQNYYPSNPNSPEAMANKTLTELNSLQLYNGDNADQVLGTFIKAVVP